MCCSSRVAVDGFELTDERDLSDDQRALLEEVSAETLSGPELTAWEYEPGSRDDSVEDVLAEIRAVYEES